MLRMREGKQVFLEKDLTFSTAVDLYECLIHQYHSAHSISELPSNTSTRALPIHLTVTRVCNVS